MLRHGLHAIHALTLARGAARFARALRDPERAQHARLRRFLRDHAASDYGRRHGYDRIDSLAAFQARVPVVDHVALAPEIARIAAGERGVLSMAPVKLLERTSGSTGGDKLIPYTADLLADFSAATDAWLMDLLTGFPGVWGGAQYWSLSPVTRARTRTAGGVPVGIEDDAEYFGPVARWVVGQTMAVPSAVRHTADIDAWRDQTLHHLLTAADLGFISVWSPSFLTLLLDALERDLERHLLGLPRERVRQIRAGLASEGRLTLRALWPKLGLVSCWADGPAAVPVKALQDRLGGVLLQPKGLLATEGVFSVPLRAARGGAVAALTSHVLELVDVEHPQRILPVHEARVGAAYSVLLTAGNGFARYHLKDVVRCTGHLVRAPLFRFEGKLDRVSDLCGEKLDARAVEAALGAAADELGVQWRFALCAPVQPAAPRYRLFVESDAADARLRALGDALERKLCTQHHYGYCRRLGQLGALQVARVSDGQRCYEAALRGAGLRAGDIKPTALDARPIWESAFSQAQLLEVA